MHRASADGGRAGTVPRTRPKVRISLAARPVYARHEMPRRARSTLPSPATYHVTTRGVEKRPIVLDALDADAWVALLLDTARRYGWELDTWTLMPNHFHLLVHTLAAAALRRDAPPERDPCAAVQPPVRPQRPPVRRALHGVRRRHGGALRPHAALRVRERHPRRARRLALARARRTGASGIRPACSRGGGLSSAASAAPAPAGSTARGASCRRRPRGRGSRDTSHTSRRASARSRASASTRAAAAPSRWRRTSPCAPCGSATRRAARGAAARASATPPRQGAPAPA